jgi:uncharacterized phiE125 gp8 family phage protein
MSQKLVTGPTVLAVSLADAKANLRIDGADMDALVTIWLQGVIATLEHEIGQRMMSQTWTVTLDAFDGAITLPHPVISITHIKYRDTSNVEQTLAPAAYRIKPEAYNTSVAPVSGTSWPDTYDETGAVVVTCVCGYGATDAATPANVRLYVLAKLEADYGPRSQTAGSIAVSDRLSRLLDACRSYQ